MIIQLAVSDSASPLRDFDGDLQHVLDTSGKSRWRRALTGDPVFNFPSSMLFAPAVTMPLLAVQGMPVGVQVMGQQHEDARITAMARWLMGNLPPVVAA